LTALLAAAAVGLGACEKTGETTGETAKSETGTTASKTDTGKKMDTMKQEDDEKSY